MANIASGNDEARGLLQPLMSGISLLRSCCERMERKIQDEAGLSEAQCVFLAAIPADRPINTGDLCRAVNLSASRGSRVVEDLVRLGLVNRQPDPVDRRIALVALTPEGLRLKYQVESLLQTCEAEVSMKLTEKELATVQEGLSLLLRAMNQF